MDIRLKRAYDAPSTSDGQRILVDRLWPRGLTKEAAQIDVWMKDIAPSNELRKWFHQDPSQWEEFAIRYHAELVTNPVTVARVQQLREAASRGAVTLIYSAKTEEKNNATVLRDLILRQS